MITFDEGKARFNYRVVAVASEGNRVLVHRAEGDDFWTLPGGRGELLEPAKETLRREMREELGVEVDVGRLVWVVENFFEYEKMSYHELALYFLISLPENSPLYEEDEFPGDEEGVKLIFKWFPLDELEGIRLYPTFLRQALKAIPEAPEYIVHTDSKG